MVRENLKKFISFSYKVIFTKIEVPYSYEEGLRLPAGFQTPKKSLFESEGIHFAFHRTVQSLASLLPYKLHHHSDLRLIHPSTMPSFVLRAWTASRNLITRREPNTAGKLTTGDVVCLVVYLLSFAVCAKSPEYSAKIIVYSVGFLIFSVGVTAIVVAFLVSLLVVPYLIRKTPVP